MKFNTEYTNDRPRPKFDQTGQTSMTKQADVERSEIQLLLKKYDKSFLIQQSQAITNQYSDVAIGFDLQDAYNKIRGVESMFMELPSAIRNRFDNNPAKFVDFCENPDNIDDMVLMNLANPPEGWTHPDNRAPVEPPVEPAGEPQNEPQPAE